MGKVIMIWENGRLVYHLISDNYFLVLTMVFALWGLSYIIAVEKEVRGHDIARD